MVRKLQARYEILLSWVAFVAPAITRCMLGYAMWVDGEGKLNHLDRVTNFFSTLYLPFSNTPLPYPAVQAHAVAALEYYGGFLLLLGLFTRPVSLLLMGAMLGALLMSDSGEFVSKWSDGTPTDATSFTNFVLALWTLMVGAGAWSLDGIIGWFYREWLEPGPSLRSRLGGVVSCQVVRGLILLAVLALVPVSDGPADRLVSTGIRTRTTRAPRPGEFDTPPPQVVEYPPNVGGICLYGLVLLGIGGGIYYGFRPAPAPPAAPPPEPSDG